MSLFVLMGAALLMGQPPHPGWAVAPQPMFPSAAAAAGIADGSARLTCSASGSGDLSNCVVQTEAPPGYGFGQAALDSIRGARVNPSSDGAPRPAVSFTISFVLQGDVHPPDESAVTLDCELLQDGSVRDCRIVQESPESRGLGQHLIDNPQYIRSPAVGDWSPGQRTRISMYPGAPPST